MKLEEEKRILLEELRSLGHKTGGGDENWEVNPGEGQEADPNDLADHFEDYEEKSSTIVTLEKRFNDVNDALGKIQAGIFGICEIDGEPIEKERLEANPAARTCIKHKEENI